MRVSWLTTGLFLAYFGLTNSASAQAGGMPPPYYYPATPNAAPPTPYPTGVRPMVLRYEPGGSPPPGYHLEESPRKALIVSGALTFGIPYLISLTIGGASRHEADRWLMLPVVGPVGTLTYGTRGCDRDSGADCAAEILIVTGLAFDLAAQTAGAILIIMGYVFPKKQWVNDVDVARGTMRPFTWSVLPRIDAAGRAGLTLSGTIF